jgi:hypothetical protein
MFQTKIVEKITVCDKKNPPKNRAVYEAMLILKFWKQKGRRRQLNTAQKKCDCTPDKAKHKQSEYVIFIASLRRQSLHESVSMLRHTFIACLD